LSEFEPLPLLLRPRIKVKRPPCPRKSRGHGTRASAGVGIQSKTKRLASLESRDPKGDALFYFSSNKNTLPSKQHVYPREGIALENFLSRFASTDLSMLCLFAMAFLTGTVTIIGNYWYKHRRLETETALKQDMLNRGMSAEDIERVIRASAGKDCESSSKKV
jgi:hypothetical protein